MDLFHTVSSVLCRDKALFSSLQLENVIAMVSAKLRAQALPPKKKKKAPQAPETADEFLAAGVDEEEGGEKWRAGDIVKSSRFL